MSRAPHIHNVLCMAPEHCVNCEYSCRVRFISNARNGSSILLFTVHTGSHSVNSLYPRLSCLRALFMLCCCAVCTLFNVFFFYPQLTNCVYTEQFIFHFFLLEIVALLFGCFRCAIKTTIKLSTNRPRPALMLYSTFVCCCNCSLN